jgi:hypothetical protein
VTHTVALLFFELFVFNVNSNLGEFLFYRCESNVIYRVWIVVECSYFTVLLCSVSNTTVKITCRMITNITRIVRVTCHYLKRYDV